MAGDEEGLSEVAGDDFFRLTDGGEIDAGVPAEEKIDVRRYLLELPRAQGMRCGAQERLEQFGDAGGVHAGIILDGAVRGCESRMLGKAGALSGNSSLRYRCSRERFVSPSFAVLDKKAGPSLRSG
jgi:hypothetical protein